MECDDHHCAVEATSANIVTEFVFHFCLYFHLYLYSCGVWSMMTIIGQWRPHRLIDLKFIHTEYILSQNPPNPIIWQLKWRLTLHKIVLFVQCIDMMYPAVITSAWPFFYWGMWYILLVVPYPHLYRGSGQANLMWPKHGRQSVKELWASDKTPTS